MKGNGEVSLVVVGSANVDLVLDVSLLPGPGETVLGRRFHRAWGGKGANQAVAAARLGARTVFVGRLGKDGEGRAFREALAGEDLDLTWLQEDPELHTGTALIFVGPGGENLIGVAPGANQALGVEGVRRAAPAFRGARAVLAQLEVPLETVEEAARIAKGHGVTVVLNPAPALELEDELLRTVDFLVPNEAEASAISGIRVTDAKSAQRAALKLLERGAGGVVVTLGELARGAPEGEGG